jgi:alpha-mannosidase
VTLLGDLAGEGKLAADIPFGVEPRDPEHDIYVHNVPERDLGIADMFERLRPGFFWARSWVDWSAAGHGCTWISADGCYYWHKEPEALGHVVLRCMRPTPGTWEERFGEHLQGGGVHTFAYALHLHDGNWRAVDAQRRSAELHHPPVALRAAGEALPTLPPAHSFLEVRGCALLSACYRDGHGATVVRIYEHEGKGGEAVLRLDWAPARAQAVDLVGQPASVPLRLAGQEAHVTLRPWQIVTLKLEAS